MTKVAIIQKEIPHCRIQLFKEVSTYVSTMGFDGTVYSTETKSLKTEFKFACEELPSVAIHK